MAANRKLLSEIQQVLKKYEEGVVLFDDIWEKVYAAEQQSLKEKYESDLKKEIKKLQRLRDQIKTWIGSNEIKDKSQLFEARKVIESKMEQFKICEKDTKTKAYSKEGLAREAKLDPKDALKEEKRNWINECLEKLSDLIDSVEADKEKLLSAKSKQRAANRDQLEKLENRIQKHKWHTAKLELIIKLIDNDQLEPALLDNVKDSLDYYIESAGDDDGEVGIEDEFDIYEDLELESLGIGTGLDFPQKTEDSPAVIETAVSESSDAKKQSAPVSKIALSRPSLPSGSQKVASIVGTVQPGKSVINQKAANVSAPFKKVSAVVEDSTEIEAEMVSAPPSKVVNNSAPSSWVHAASSAPSVATVSSVTAAQSSTIVPADVERPSKTAVVDNGALLQSETKLDTPVVSREELLVHKNAKNACSPFADVTHVDTDGRTGSPLPSKIPMNPELMTLVNMLKSSLANAPQALETDRSSTYVPRSPYSESPSCFPATPLFSNPQEVSSYYERLPVDTLFYTFYFQQGTYQQYLAAKQLKKQSWRFHKKYMTWFQRHEEPRIATEEFEEGSYVYFDYESGTWCQRIKSDFKFEYGFLEDELNHSHNVM